MNSNTDITKNNYSKHFKSQQHIYNYNIKFREFNKLKEWASYNCIYDFNDLIRGRLKEIRECFVTKETILMYTMKEN